MSELDNVVFGKKKFSDLLQEIYTNQNKKSTQITALIAELKPLITDIGDATLIVPLLKEYLEIGVKNDDMLVKLAGIIQRINSGNKDNSGEGGGFLLSEEEKKQLLNKVEDLKKDSEQ